MVEVIIQFLSLLAPYPAKILNHTNLTLFFLQNILILLKILILIFPYLVIGLGVELSYILFNFDPYSACDPRAIKELILL